MENLTTIVGTVGAGIILIFFLLNQTNKMSNANFWYDFGNFIGSVLLLIYAILLSSIPFAILNLIWAFASLKDVVGDVSKRK